MDALQSDDLVKEIAFGSTEDAKLINLYSMMRYNRLVWDFMVTELDESLADLPKTIPSRRVI